MLQLMTAGAARRILPFSTDEGCDRDSEFGTVYSGRGGEGPVSLKKRKEFQQKIIVRDISFLDGVAGVSFN